MRCPVVMPLKRLCILFIILLAASCSGDRASGPPDDLSETSLPGVYSGDFPCEGCPGIATTLWLRADRRFFFRQRYPADDANDAATAYSLGRWHTVDDAQVITLEGAGPMRTFMRPEPDTLIMQTDSDLEHRLNRQPGSSTFDDTIRMTGTMRMRGDSATFTECYTDLLAPVSKGGDIARFRHQYRSVGGRNRPVFAEFEGRFSWSDDGSLELLTIERFITVRTNTDC